MRLKIKNQELIKIIAHGLADKITEPRTLGHYFENAIIENFTIDDNDLISTSDKKNNRESAFVDCKLENKKLAVSIKFSISTTWNRLFASNYSKSNGYQFLANTIFANESFMPTTGEGTLGSAKNLETIIKRSKNAVEEFDNYCKHRNDYSFAVLWGTYPTTINVGEKKEFNMDILLTEEVESTKIYEYFRAQLIKDKNALSKKLKGNIEKLFGVTGRKGDKYSFYKVDLEEDDAVKKKHQIERILQNFNGTEEDLRREIGRYL